MPLDRALVFAGPSLEKARTCIEYRDCVKRCPYKLDIPALLKEKLTFWDKVKDAK
jgi:predicted aldo/keto reductase-like oxidoreductase